MERLFEDMCDSPRLRFHDVERNRLRCKPYQNEKRPLWCEKSQDKNTFLMSTQVLEQGFDSGAEQDSRAVHEAV